MQNFGEAFWIFLQVLSICFVLGRSDCFQGKLNSLQESETLFPDKETSCFAKDANNNNNEMVLIKGGQYEIGTDEPVFVADGEAPARQVYLDDYYIDVHEVSNQEFANFVESTSYVTEAERFGSSFVFEGILDDETKSEIPKVVAAAPWWMPVVNASWKFPEGPTSSISGLTFIIFVQLVDLLYHIIIDRMDHPVIHVSWNDAVSFCEFHGKRLPSEAEWEVACQGGLKQRLYPWGNKLNPYGKHWYP